MKTYEYLIKYAAFDTGSSGKSETCPSTPGQMVLAKELVRDMLALGIGDAAVDEHGYVYGTIPANNGGGGTTVGFIAHMDVVVDVPSTGVKPQIVKDYDGGDLIMPALPGGMMKVADYPMLVSLKGHDLVTSGGETLLGADDKAGIAEIMAMAEYFMTHPEVKHGTVKLAFTPDEEIGRGADLFDVKGFGAKFAYTVDGGAFGEVEYETFNADSAVVAIEGRNIHPGTAKNKMINASLLAMEFDAMLPKNQRPQDTEGHEGFFHLIAMEGGVEKARLVYILRDHDLKTQEARKKTMHDIAAFLNGRYGEGRFTVTTKESYRNMSEKIVPHMHLIDTARACVEKLGGTPVTPPVRGGTDGARLSYMGLPCPNLGTGSYNHHSRAEIASCQDMDKCVRLLIDIALAYSEMEK